MAFQEAPSEVLDKVFLLLPKTSVKECLFVCKLWHLIASRIFYNTVILTRSNTHKFISSQTIHYFVKHLLFNIDFPKLYILTPFQFKELMNQVPNLKILDLTGLYKSVKQYLQVLYENQLLNYIEEIKVDNDLSMQARELYILTAYKYKKNITHLHLNYLRYTIGGNYHRFLPEFGELRFLTISNDLLNGDRHMLISTILELCPKLIGFGLQMNRYFPDASKNELLLQTKMIGGKQYNNKLKRLEFEVSDFHEGYIKYIIQFIKSLNIFYLNMIDTDIYEWFIDKELNTIQLFGNYLSKIKNVTIIAEPNVTKRQQNMNNNLKDKMERNWIFINQLTKTRKFLHLNLLMKGYDDRKNFKLIMNEKRIILEYQLKPEYLINNLTCLFMYGNNKNGLELINSIEIGDAIRYTLNDCIQLLECVIHKCPNLKLFILRRAKLLYRIESLNNNNINFDQTPTEKVKNEFKESSSLILNHVTLQCATLSTELIQVLSRCLPNITVLKLKECTMIDIIDIRSIQHLFYIEIDIFFINHIVNRIFITLNISDTITFYQSFDGNLFQQTIKEELICQHTFYLTILSNNIDNLYIHTKNNSGLYVSVITPILQL